jgi:hypothetical protein
MSNPTAVGPVRASQFLIALVIAVAIASGWLVSGWLFWRYGWLSVQVAWASDQIEIIEEMREQALQGKAGKAASCLAYAVSYHPSGTKQQTGSRLDRIVEQARASAVRDIVAHLRRVTGEDLGDDPEAWIRKYAKY